jgi:hypothetical protein
VRRLVAAEGGIDAQDRIRWQALQTVEHAGAPLPS